MVLEMIHVSQRRAVMGRRRGYVGSARSSDPGSAIAVGKALLGWPSRVAGGACHASRADVAAAGARRHAVFGAKTSNSLCPTLVAGRPPD